MDTIPEPEFVSIFHRSARYINFKRVRSPKELEEELKRMQLAMLRNAEKHPSQKKKWIRKARLWTRLRLHGFHRRVWDEAIANPRSIYAYSLKYGYRRAVKMKLKEAEKRIRGGFRRRRR